MEIKLAAPEQIDTVLALVHDIVSYMQTSGLDQWNSVYPDKDTLQKDLNNATLYLLMDENKVTGMVVLNEDQDPEYQTVNWQLPAERVMVIHRLCIHPRFRRRGLSKFLMDFAEFHAHRNGYNVIRLDAYSANPAALSLYEHRGYSKAGAVNFPGRAHPFWCYEKQITPVTSGPETR